MDKKTIGQFIATLRKANGMTQKELADKLNVSDKAVSRWERDESAPDLTLIPVIAEIFGVTSDEILRGERRSSDSPVTEYSERRTEKQLQNLIDGTVFKFRIMSVVAVAVAVLGLIAAMICNFGFLRAYIGFYVAAVFYAGSCAVGTVGAITAFYSLRDAEYGDTRLNTARRRVFSLFSKTMYALISFIAVTVPLLFVGDAFEGLDIEYWLFFGLVALVVSIFVCFILNALVVKYAAPKVYTVSSTEKSKFNVNFRFILKRTAAAVLVISVTVTLQCLVNAYCDEIARALGHCTVFTDMEEFKEYLSSPGESGKLMPPDNYIVIEPPTWGSGNDEIQIDNNTGAVIDKEGNAFVFEHNNSDVSFFNLTTINGELAMVVYTHDDVKWRNTMLDAVNIVFLCAYAVEVVLLIVGTVKRWKKIKAVQ